MKVNNYDLSIKEFKGQRVVTLKDIDEMHQRPEGTARKAFNRHRDRFIEGVDVFVLDMDESKRLFSVHAPNGITLITQMGYLMLTKVFDDNLSWQVQRHLVTNYFKTKPAPKPSSDLESKLVEAKLNNSKARIANALMALAEKQEFNQEDKRLLYFYISRVTTDNRISPAYN